MDYLKWLAICLEVFILSAVFSKAAALLSARSDTAVAVGFFLLVAVGLILFASVLFWFPSLQRFFK